MKKKKQIFAVAAVLVLAGSYYWYSQSNSDEKKIEYVTAEAEKGMLTSAISASGNIIVDNQSTIDPTITGTVADLAVAVGDKVESGQFLFNIINNDLNVSVSKAAASYESAKNSLESAKIDKDNAKAVYEKAKDEDEDDGDAYTGRELDVLKDKVDLAESKIIQTEKNLAASGADYRNTQADASERKVVSAILGTVLGVNVKNGDDLSRTSSADNAALDGTDFSGKVEKIDSLGTVTQGVVSYNVSIGFEALDARIKPDMSVSASIITDVKQDILMVPSSAVKSEGGNAYVEILNGSALEQKSVRTGASNDTNTEIISGVNIGDKVVTETLDLSVEASTDSGSGSSGGNVRIPGVSGFGR